MAPILLILPAIIYTTLRALIKKVHLSCSILEKSMDDLVISENVSSHCPHLSVKPGTPHVVERDDLEGNHLK